MQDFQCGKERLVKVATPESKHKLKIITEGVQNGSLFGFAQVDIEVPLHTKIDRYFDSQVVI